MDQPISLDEIARLISQLTNEDKRRLGSFMDFRRWDDAAKKIRDELTQKRASQGLPPPTDDDVHDEFDARRTPEEWDALRREIQIAVDQADRGECIDAEIVFAQLEQDLVEQRRRDELLIVEGKPTAGQIFKLIQTLTEEEQSQLLRLRRF